MGRQFELFFPNRDVLATAELLEDLAPRTCQLFWEQLPVTEETYHTRRSGCELFVITPPWPALPGQENGSMYCEAGDIFFFYFAPGYPDAPLHLVTRGLRDYVHLGFFYGRNSQPTGPYGPVAGNRFAIFRDNLEGFAAVAQKTRQEGYETLIVRRKGQRETSPKDRPSRGETPRATASQPRSMCRGTYSRWGLSVGPRARRWPCCGLRRGVVWAARDDRSAG